MKKIRIFCLFLSLCLCLGALTSCGGREGPTTGGDRVGDSWEGVSFGGTEVKLAYSNNRFDWASFPAADIYIKGPDEAGDNEVHREVLKRNKAAADTLGIHITYIPKDLDNLDIADDVQGIVMTASKTSPDIYNNDMYGLSRAMINGHLWNVKNAGEGVQNYFDFEKDGWYTDFIKGSTFDQNKLYLFAGDYFIDMIRQAWVILVNNDLLRNHIGKVGSLKSVTELYEYVQLGMWDIDMMAMISGAVFTDGEGGIYQRTEATDAVVGVAADANDDWVLSASTGVTVYYLDENYKPTVMDSIDTFQRISKKYVQLLETPGYYREKSCRPTEYFIKGNFIFSYSMLGELEATALREFAYDKGVLPLPMWNSSEPDCWYHTVIHDQVEIGAILKSAKQFPAASALMQYLNEESKGVVHAYYDKGLKYKYTTGDNATLSREMMDIIRNAVDNPFGFQMMKLCYEQYQGDPKLEGLFLANNSTLSSTFASEKDAYAWCMNEILRKFAAME